MADAPVGETHLRLQHLARMISLPAAEQPSRTWVVIWNRCRKAWRFESSPLDWDMGPESRKVRERGQRLGTLRPP